MTPKNILVFIGVILSLICKTYSICDKTPSGISGPRNRNDAGRYIIDIPGNPKSYTASQRYNITLKVRPEEAEYKSFQNFMLTLEPAEENADHLVGQLNIARITETVAEFSVHCPNTVVETNAAAKTEIQVYWDAPPKGSGCVAIKATVVESKENWFSEDGPLTKILCEESKESENIQPSIRRHCCACNEAKYELALEGRWTRNTHPRHFPLDLWNTRFSDVIGASHQYNHAFWRYDDVASSGLEELARYGETKTLESELKDDSEHIRTIIKARGLQYPNITKTTYAVFRVDSKNHLVSVVSKIMPSPDWIIGVSNYELCKEDCTWEESRTLNLYPWDAGIDDALNYSSSIPVPNSDKRLIERITPNNPNRPESPFYSENGEEIKPIAKLHLTRQRLYDKTCENTESNELDCSTNGWSEWSMCSATCGSGTKFRQRSLVNPNELDNCKHVVKLMETQNCYEHCTYKKLKDVDEEAGAETEDETMRKLKDSDDAEETEKETVTEPGDSTTASPEEDEEIEDCQEGDENCEKDPKCPGYFWGAWKSCDVTCGVGIKTRFRVGKKPELESGDIDDYDKNCPYRQNATCEVPCNIEEADSTFGKINSNSIVISQEPDGRVVDCKVSEWSRWGPCVLDDKDNICGEGYKNRTRVIRRHPENGGKACPKELMKLRRCAVPCPIAGECIMSRWSNWTPCSSNCGGSAVQIRTRNILYQPPGITCPKREVKRRCNLPLTCNPDGKPILD